VPDTVLVAWVIFFHFVFPANFLMYIWVTPLYRREYLRLQVQGYIALEWKIQGLNPVLPSFEVSITVLDSSIYISFLTINKLPNLPNNA
jgi:hypothetical protein